MVDSHESAVTLLGKLLGRTDRKRDGFFRGFFNHNKRPEIEITDKTFRSCRLRLVF